VSYDLIVIGTGPGGYHAAIRAAQLGLDVAAVEAEAIGGVCLNSGCIPTKALLHAAAEIEHARRAADYGLNFGAPDIDLARLAGWRDGIVDKLSGGVGALLRGRGIRLYSGWAQFVDANTINVGDEQLTADQFIIATGAEAMALDGFDDTHPCIIDSSGALQIETGIPDRFLVIGAGAVGLEFAAVLNRFGAAVTVAEALPQILPAGDAEMVAHYADMLAQQGIDIRTGMRATVVEYGDDQLQVRLSSDDGDQAVQAFDRVLVAVGRRSCASGLNLAAAGVDCDERGFVAVDSGMRTSAGHIYAIGDVTGPPLLAHKAMKEGLVAAANAVGHDLVFDYQVPNVIYTEPEWAAVGMTQAEAEDRGIRVRSGKFPLSASGRAMTLNDTTGVIKIIGDADTDLLLGVHIVGPGASELIGEAALALEMAATVTDLKWTVHPHPTLTEGIMEAAAQFCAQAIHLPA